MFSPPPTPELLRSSHSVAVFQSPFTMKPNFTLFRVSVSTTSPPSTCCGRILVFNSWPTAIVRLRRAACVPGSGEAPEKMSLRFFSIDENRAAWFAPSRNVLGTVCGYAFRQWNCACAEKLVLFWISLIWLKSNFRRVVDQCSFEKKCFVRCFLCSLLLATSARLRHCLSYVRAFHCITDVCLEFHLLQQIIYQQRSSCLVTSSLDTRTTRRITRGHRKAPPQKRVYAPHKLLVLNLLRTAIQYSNPP